LSDDATPDPDRHAPAHLPVLGPQAVAAVLGPVDGTYVDGTFGRGGHSALLLAALGPRGRLVAIDRDPQAVASAGARPPFAGDARFSIAHARFSTLDHVLDALGIDTIDGLLLDLGVSSPQFDDPARGFTFSGDGPLDMRMDPTEGLPVRDWLRSASEQDIAEVLRNYGDERFAVPIAKAIAARGRQAGDAAFQSTRELADLVAGVVRRRQKRSAMVKNPATRTYQALRIHTNSEIAELARVLTLALRRLAIGGRLAIISFHSIEDRMVKQFIARHAGRSGERDPITGASIAPVLLQSLGRITPDAAEIAANPRARSAVLRVARKLAEPLVAPLDGGGR
jgi:16S rRNA (cytosine1402-N4)-methyltransferase